MSRPKKLPTILNNAEIKALTTQASPRYITGHRNRIMMQIMLSLGLRLAEVVSLKWDDIDFLSEVLMIREGKGMKDRTLFIKDDNWRGVDDKQALQEWKERQVQHLGMLPEYVFTTMSKNSQGTQLSDKYVQAMIQRYSERAGIGKKISPHTLRHTFATMLYKHTKDIAVVQKALGHADLSTTMIYVHLVNGDVEQALSSPAKPAPEKPELIKEEPPMKRTEDFKEFAEVAGELNKVLGLNPPIQTFAITLQGLKAKLKEAKELVEPTDEISQKTLDVLDSLP